ncbi:MAG: PEP-utilizing enzyme [Solirubrobacteraceae bacterium]
MEQVAIDFKQVGTGTSVFPADPVEGPVRWLDSPQAVIEFVSSGEVENTIVLARGGTTTFLTPALTGGVKGVITLQGAPESHLGILSREYGIPCVMGVSFTEGVRSARGEIIPADGATVRLETAEKKGRVLIDPAAPVDDTPLPELTEEQAAAAAMMEQIVPLLHNYLGQIPHGGEGDRQMRAGHETDVLSVTRENVSRPLTVAELNELQAYMAWNIWDFLALRATEGESGLIPRQEYETFGCVWQWLRYPEYYRLILDAVGVDGLIEIGATPRREPGSKANMLHTWCTGFTPMFGRAILGELGMLDPAACRDEVNLLLQFMRALYYGLWGAQDGQAIFTSMRGYKAALLDREWIDRFAADAERLEGDDRTRFTSFNASTEMLGFLLHFDNRSGLCDSGPYDLGDGRFMIVRDHFLYDPMYHWHDVAQELPHCFTQAMIFNTGGAELEVNLVDGGTIFTEPANYLQYLESAAVYVRERWDTPASEIRRLDQAEIQRYLELCGPPTTALYKRIASMPKRDKIMAGAQVYYSEFVVPFARLAGVWDQIRDELDFHELDPVASEAYYPLVRDGQGQQIMGKAFVTGTGFPPLPDEAEVSTADGIDREALKAIYERFLAVNQPFKSLCFRFQEASEDARFEFAGELATIVERVQPALRRTIELLPEFDGYGQRLTAAMEQVEQGAHEYVTSVRVDSLHTVWMEIHETYLNTLGISREQEGSY